MTVPPIFNIAAHVAGARLGIARISVGWPGCVRSDHYPPPADVMARCRAVGQHGGSAGTH